MLVIENRHFSADEMREIEMRALQMADECEVEVYMMVGAHQVCLKRTPGKIDIYKMVDTLERNEKQVTRFNKRNKQGMGSERNDH